MKEFHVYRVVIPFKFENDEDFSYSSVNVAVENYDDRIEIAISKAKEMFTDMYPTATIGKVERTVFKLKTYY